MRLLFINFSKKFKNILNNQQKVIFGEFEYRQRICLYFSTPCFGLAYNFKRFMQSGHQPTTPPTLPKYPADIKLYNSPDPCDCLIKQKGEEEESYDFYSIEVQNFIYYTVNRKRSPYIQQEPDPKLRQSLIKKTKRLRNVYTVQRCKYNQFHVVIISSKKPVPMLNRSLQMLKDCHRDHEDSYKMQKKLSEKYENFSLNFIKKYIYQFVIRCPNCTKNVEKLPFWESHNLDIMEEIRQAKLHNMDPHEQENDNFSDVFYDDKNCPYNCKQDKYDNYYSFLCKLYLEGRKQLDDLDIDQIEKKKIRRELSECKMTKCNRNTEHLWRLDYKYRNEPKWKYDNLKMQAYKRIPMQQEKLLIAKMLHGKKHRHPQKMVLGIAKLPFLFKILREYILNNHNYCDFCRPAAKLKQLEAEKKKQNNSTECSLQHTRPDLQNQVVPKFMDQYKLIKDMKGNGQHEKENAVLESVKKHKLIQKLKMEQDFINAKQMFVKMYAVENGSPNVIVVSSLSLQKSYHTFGDCLYFESFTHLLFIQQSWKTYFFSGLDEGKNQIIFGACLIDKPSFQAFFYAFTLFFEIMYNQYPRSICTPYDVHISQALDSLISYSQQESLRRVTHCYIWNSCIYLFTEMIQNQGRPPGTISKIIEAIKTTSPKKCQQIFELLKLHLESDSQILANLQQQKEKLCWTQLPPSFIGLCFDSSHTQNFIKLLDRYFPVRKSPYDFINQVGKIRNPHYKFGVNSSRTLYFAPEIQDLRSDLHPKIMQLLTSRCILSYKISHIQWRSSIQGIIEQELGTFSISYSLAFDHWECSCLQLYRTGVPCSHLIRIIKEMGGQIRYYINQRWLLNKQC